MRAEREKTWVPSANAYLLARARVARKLVRDGHLEFLDALDYVTAPTAAILAAERAAPNGTTISRAFRASA